ncbi:MAG: hypothetical protein LIV11_06535 [Bacillota bacterium]|nr:hypothetical protein [Bacillota bacterium]
MFTSIECVPTDTPGGTLFTPERLQIIGFPFPDPRMFPFLCSYGDYISPLSDKSNTDKLKIPQEILVVMFYPAAACAACGAFFHRNTELFSLGRVQDFPITEENPALPSRSMRSEAQDSGSPAFANAKAGVHIIQIIWSQKEGSTILGNERID